MAGAAEKHKPVHIMGAGLSGLAAATILAKAGREVHVHDIRADSGARFDGDFQALENWSMSVDFFDQLKEWGFDLSTFKATEFSSVDIIHPDDVISQAETPSVAYRIVERGTSSHTIDQGFKQQALDAGAQIHYKSRVKEEDCTIIACGPKGTSAVAYGEIFNTDHPNHIGFQLNDKLAPGSYSYLIIIDGVGLICTCLWRKQKKSDRFLNETIAWYDAHYPGLNRKPIKRVGGKGDFTINRHYKQHGRYYVGESGGLQDFMWGFGMRMAVWSGVLAARDILGEGDYEADVRRHLMPYVRTSVANRWLMNRVGDRTFKRMCNAWMKDQKKRGDGLVWIGKLFRPSLLKSLVYRCVSPFMLVKDPKAMGRGVRRMPFRAALKRDEWEPSEQANQIKAQWDEIRRGGGQVSFSEAKDSES
ncbi:MAG: NAD(P)-binding protein [Candidatus Poseidonia sp.]|uniref:NAD(P)/FAD-dependent oxidoreductase n=1 Tax=Poseidonia sp. TaxID=2666344 RepID=UPI0030C511BC|nr:NAD(P)-binding protein [Poseidonia sp.]